MACTHSESTEVMDRSRRIDGSATSTIVVSMMNSVRPSAMKIIGVQPTWDGRGGRLGGTWWI